MEPGETGHKLQVTGACPIQTLRMMVAEKTNVQPQCQMLVYRGQALVDKHHETHEVQKLQDYIVEQGNKSIYLEDTF